MAQYTLTPLGETLAIDLDKCDKKKAMEMGLLKKKPQDNIFLFSDGDILLHNKNFSVGFTNALFAQWNVVPDTPEGRQLLEYRRAKRATEAEWKRIIKLPFNNYWTVEVGDCGMEAVVCISNEAYHMWLVWTTQKEARAYIESGKADWLKVDIADLLAKVYG